MIPANGSCEHDWVYAGGVCRCSKCKAYLQPGGDVTTTPTGRGGKVLEHITESPVVHTVTDNYQLELPNFLPIWERTITKQTDQYLSDTEPVHSPIDASVISELMVVLKKLITDELHPVQETYDQISSMLNRSGIVGVWSHGFTSFRLMMPYLKTVDPANNIEAEFVIPEKIFSSDFIERFIAGRETISGLLHRQPSIELRLSPNVIDRCSTAGEIMTTLQSAIEYYDHGIDELSRKMIPALCQLKPDLRQLVITGPLAGVMLFPIMCFVNVSNINVGIEAFKASQKMIEAAEQFPLMISQIADANPADQAKALAIISDSFKVAFASPLPREMLATINQLTDALQKYCDGKLHQLTERTVMEWESAQVASSVMTEAGGRGKVKRLKKIPNDLVSYIVIEGEAVRDANDKMLIVSYGYGKLEIVEWYIELIDVQSKRYIVPHTRDYLVTLKHDLLEAIRKIMNTPIPKPSDPAVQVNYPAGYEG